MKKIQIKLVDFINWKECGYVDKSKETTIKSLGRRILKELNEGTPAIITLQELNLIPFENIIGCEEKTFDNYEVELI
jgi:hypothetical protein